MSAADVFAFIPDVRMASLVTLGLFSVLGRSRFKPLASHWQFLAFSGFFSEIADGCLEDDTSVWLSYEWFYG